MCIVLRPIQHSSLQIAVLQHCVYIPSMVNSGENGNFKTCAAIFDTIKCYILGP